MKQSTKTDIPLSALQASKTSSGTFLWCHLLTSSTLPSQTHWASEIRTTIQLPWFAASFGSVCTASLLCGSLMMLQRHLDSQQVFSPCSCIPSVSLFVTRRSLTILLFHLRSSKRNFPTRRSLWLKPTLLKSSKWPVAQALLGYSTLKLLANLWYSQTRASNSKFQS